MAEPYPPGRPPRLDEATVVRPRGGAGGGVLQPGVLLGHTYVIEALLGRSALGEVYRARHAELGTTHAIKLISPVLASDPKGVQLLVEEARKLAQVRHEAIVGYEGLFRDEQGLRYLVMEFVHGPSLQTVLAGRRLEPDEVLRLRDRLAAGLAAVHNHGIIHRDISPDNIILPDGEVGRAKLIGFGFATTAGARDPTLIGTNLAARHAFASPEHLGLFGGHVDSRSDLYSLGLVLAAAAIGFGGMLDMGATPTAAIAARQKSPDLAAVPAALRPVIAPMLAPRPEDRTASARDLLAHASAPDAGAARRGRWPMALGAAAAALVVAAVAAVVLFRVNWAGLPTPEALRGQLAAVTADYACAALSYKLAPDRSVHLTGHVASSEDLARLRRATAAIPGIGRLAFDVQVMAPPHCEVAALLEPFAGGTGRDSPALAFASKSGATFIGDRPALDVRAPSFDSYLYIDYFDSGSGQVLHLFPNARDRFNLRPWHNRFVLFKSPLWTVCGNVGRQLITLLATAKPLFAARRPDVEAAHAYLAGLGEVLRQVPHDKAAAALLFFDLRDAPPWVNREAACPSG